MASAMSGSVTTAGLSWGRPVAVFVAMGRMTAATARNAPARETSGQHAEGVQRVTNTPHSSTSRRRSRPSGATRRPLDDRVLDRRPEKNGVPMSASRRSSRSRPSIGMYLASPPCGACPARVRGDDDRAGGEEQQRLEDAWVIR